MRVLRDYLNNNTDPVLLNLRQQLLAHIKEFALLLAQEGLLYPQLAEMFYEEYKWYGREMQHATGDQSDRYKARCLEDALQAARTKLDLDVLCTGHNSAEVAKTLGEMIDLKMD